MKILETLNVNLLDLIVSQVSKQTCMNICRDYLIAENGSMKKVKKALINKIEQYLAHGAISKDLIDYAVKHGKID